MNYDIYGNPLATPTPYISPSQGGNMAIVPGSQTQPVAAGSTPIKSLTSGGVLFSGGENIPSYNVIGSGNQNVSRTVQNQNLGANTTTLNNAPAPAPTQDNQGNSQQDIINAYKAMGWTDVNAILADYNATGGSKIGGSSGGGSDPYAQVRSDINSGYDSYFANLNDQLNQLPGQQASQNQIIENSYNQGVSDLNLQQTQGEAQFGSQRGEIASNQSKNLKSLDENLRNMFMAGNVYLGSRGAGDSSAANQYSYALTKQGNQARGDQLTAATKAYSEVQARETNLKNIVNNEMTKLKTNADNEKLKVGQWFVDAQNQVKTAIANGQLSKSTDLANLSKSILDQAMSRLQKIQDNTTNLQNSLVSWAENNATSIGQLKSNLQQILSVAPSLAGQSTVNGTPSVDSQGNFTLQGLGTGTSTQKKDIFGNIIS
jgi:hypothetical protein